ncbi:hypothetical protein BT96DRAFT_976506, partial [Gymnopus androsaceus JB14]
MIIPFSRNPVTLLPLLSLPRTQTTSKKLQTAKAPKEFNIASGLKATLPAATFQSISNLFGHSSDTGKATANTKSPSIEDFTSTTSIILGYVRGISEALFALQNVAGLGTQGVNELNECKEEWEEARSVLVAMEHMMAQFQSHQNTLTISPIVLDVFQQMENCLQQVQEVSKTHSDVTKLYKMLQQNTLKNEVVSCVSSIKDIQRYFQSYMIFGPWKLPQMFTGASNFKIHKSTFIASSGPVNVYEGAPQAVNNGQDISNVLQCPSPSQYFVGREDTLKTLSKIFSAPIVTVWGTKMDALRKLIRQNLKFSSPIFLDASSGHALKIYADMIQNQVTSTEELLVLENADTSLLSADYLSALFDIPMLLISCNPVISSLASCTASSFQLHDGPDRE